jgi:hypothetical protein
MGGTSAQAADPADPFAAAVGFAARGVEPR